MQVKEYEKPLALEDETLKDITAGEISIWLSRLD
jgi:hypothetical protein